MRQIRLTGARHPLLAGKVVPVTVQLGGDHRVMLITGPNAGGKTVTLKMVGLLALMAHAGLHVPADEAAFPLLDGVYADIGDQQSIEQSLSTFSSHIRNLMNIMDRATSDSLVLVDELGTSTDPEEGSALAKGILGHFEAMGLLMVATTHHRGVAHYVQEQPAMINASVDLHPQTLEPTFRVTQGLPGRSYALTIASRLGLPPDIVEQARSSLSPVEQATENILGELQEERKLVEDLRGEAEEALARVREQQTQLDAQLASVESAKLELVEQARRELQEQTRPSSRATSRSGKEVERVCRERVRWEGAFAGTEVPAVPSAPGVGCPPLGAHRSIPSRLARRHRRRTEGLCSRDSPPGGSDGAPGRPRPGGSATGHHAGPYTRLPTGTSGGGATRPAQPGVEVSRPHPQEHRQRDRPSWVSGRRASGYG